MALHKFMENFKPVHPAPTKGHKSGTMKDHTPVNPKTPVSSKPSQFTATPKMSGPVKTGKGALGGVK